MIKKCDLYFKIVCVSVCVGALQSFTHRFEVPCYIKSFQPVLLTAFCASARQPSPFLLWWVSAGRLHGSSDVISLPCRVTLHDSVHRMLIVVASSVSRPSSPFRSLFRTPPHPLSAPPCWQFDFGVSALCWRPVSGASSYFKGRMKMPSLAGSRISLSETFFFSVIWDLMRLLFMSMQCQELFTPALHIIYP